MLIQGMKLKTGKDIGKGKLYEFDENTTIHFCEKESQDCVDIVFELQEGDRALYGNEYRPDTVAKDGAKVIDITAAVLNDSNKTVRYYLFDDKKNVGGEDVIYKLCEQWEDSLKYFNLSVVGYLDDYESQRNIGVITRDFDTNRVNEAILKKTESIEKINNLQGTLAGAKQRINIPRLKGEIELLSLFVDNKVKLKVNGNEEILDFSVRKLEETPEGKWNYILYV